MLSHIHIQNFTIIKELDLDFKSGMTVLTGETGAGKSILIDALEFVLGGRADSRMIRPGNDCLDISALFDLQQIPLAQQWLQDQQFDHNECILRRTFTSDGRSRNTLNGKPLSLPLMRELGTLLVNIHGQHEHQSLFKRDEQCRLLDTYADHTGLLNDVRRHYKQWRNLQDELKKWQIPHDNRAARSELLRYQVHELEVLALGEQELFNLEKEHKQLTHADHLLAQCQNALAHLNDAEETNALRSLNIAKTALNSIKEMDPVLLNASELLGNASIYVKEAIDELEKYIAKVELNPARLHQIEQRLQVIHDIARKHQIKPEELLPLQQRLIAELKQLEQADGTIAKWQEELAQCYQSYLIAAQKLSKSREKAAKKINVLITESLQKLGMPGSRFEIYFESYEEPLLSLHGLDRLEFKVSTNPGQPLQPLTKVVSGGELSRISLAIQVIIAQNENVPTLIFDEVDVGIGGGTAEIVGRLLQKLSKTSQILCITHLPQVAAQGDHHIEVCKHTEKNETQTQIRELNKEARIREIARMLGGIKITEQTLAHARELVGAA